MAFYYSRYILKYTKKNKIKKFLFWFKGNPGNLSHLNFTRNFWNSGKDFCNDFWFHFVLIFAFIRYNYNESAKIMCYYAIKTKKIPRKMVLKGVKSTLT